MLVWLVQVARLASSQGFLSPTPSPKGACADEIAPHLYVADLSSARAAAAAYATKDASRRKECAKAWVQQMAGVEARPAYISLVRSSHSAHSGVRSLAAVKDCWGAAENHGGRTWLDCCMDPARLRCFDNNPKPSHDFLACCALSPGSRSFLSIPALMASSVVMRLPTDRLLRLEQDGFLRPYGKVDLMRDTVQPHICTTRCAVNARKKVSLM